MKFGILGHGRFGKLWADCLQPFGEVLVHDPNQEKTNSLAETLNVDFLFLAVPMSSFEQVCKDIAPQIPAHTVVVDLCSVKVHPAEVMLKHFSSTQALIATHPLFGPDSVKSLGLAGRKIVLCPLRVEPELQEKFLNIFEKMELVVMLSTPQEHDEQMAKSQALVHFIGRGLASLRLSEQAMSTPDYQALLKIDSVVNNDTWELFYNMQQLNPFTAQIRHSFLQKLQDLNDEIDQPSCLDDYRQNIEFIDQSIVHLLGQRMKWAHNIGRIKKQEGHAVRDEAREQKLKALHREIAEKEGVPHELVEDLFDQVMAASRSLQSKL
jgi:prephenate dehydrogenase